jgi:hypothetical protein
MRHKFQTTFLVAALGAALAFAGPAAAQRNQSGGGPSGSGIRAGGGPAQVSGPARMGGPAQISGPARFSGAPGVSGGAIRNRGAVQVNRGGPVFDRGARVAARNFDRGDYRHRRVFHRRPGFAVGVATGAFAAYPWGYDPYYDDDYAYDGDYAYYDDDEDGYETYAAAPDTDVQYCIQRFRSYDVATRTYLGFDGLRHPCP